MYKFLSTKKLSLDNFVDRGASDLALWKSMGDLVLLFICQMMEWGRERCPHSHPALDICGSWESWFWDPKSGWAGYAPHWLWHLGRWTLHFTWADPQVSKLWGLEKLTLAPHHVPCGSMGEVNMHSPSWPLPPVASGNS